MKKLIEKYNRQDTLLVISSYPEKGKLYSGKVCAVGGYTKNTIKALQKKYSKEYRKIVILTVQTCGKEEIYEEDNMLIVRCIRRNKPFSYIRLVRYIQSFTLSNQVLAEFEFASFGDTRMTVLFPLIIWYLKTLGKHTTLVLHQVVDSLQNIDGHIGIGKNNLYMKVLDIGLKLFYRTMTKISSGVVVLEDEFKKRLSGYCNPEKVIVIPHGVDNNVKIISKIEAREKLRLNKDEIIVLYFGYLTWYKGADFFAETFSKSNMEVNGKRVRFVMAGGESFTQKKKKHYRLFLDKVYHNIRKGNNISITGFVPEEKISLYFAACDLVLLPYRVFMSSSGPMSMVFSYKKPFAISENLKKITYTKDFSESIENAGLQRNDFIFRLDKKSCRNMVRKILGGRKLEKIRKLSEEMGKKRCFNATCDKYEYLFQNNLTNAPLSLAPSMFPVTK